MEKVLKEIFSPHQAETIRPLFVFEMANNHMGSVEHGLKIIREFHQIAQKFDFNFAFKFQFRHIETFIHPDYKKRLDIKYVKRFSETRFSEKQWQKLKKEVDKLGFISICTPFDEKSVNLIKKLKFDVIKIASCSFGDWPLLEKVAKTNKPIIISTAGANLKDIDQVVSFFQHRGKRFALMHCVGEYPTQEENLQLNQIDLLKQRYPEIPIGFSTHEDPDNLTAVQMSIAKGAKILERHVAIKTKKYALNAYSSTPKQTKSWLNSAKTALEMCGVVNQRAEFPPKELSDLRQFKRGVFAKRKIKKGNRIRLSDVFFAFPNQEGQVLANDMSKYTQLQAKQDIAKNAPLIKVKKVNIRQKIYSIVKKADRLLKKSKIAIPKRVDFEISYHYGLDQFYKFGGVLVNCVNRDYCKKLIIMFPGQKHPTQFHKKKEETFHILGGEFIIILNGKKKTYSSGDIVTVEPKVKHSMMTKTGGVLEEISSTHYRDDSYYEDEKIGQNKNRKTYLTYWVD